MFKNERKIVSKYKFMCGYRYEMKCLNCGKIFTVTKSYYDKGQGFFCSYKCSNKYSGKQHYGKNHQGYKHGMTHTIFYKKWSSMKRRCLNKNDKRYNRYGGRGITVCKEWLGFKGFYNDMYKSYLKHCKKYGKYETTIERIDVNGNYELNNCKWATWKEQHYNTSYNKYITYKNKTKSLSQWAEELGFKRSTLYQRIFILNWTIDKAFSKKV